MKMNPFRGCLVFHFIWFKCGPTLGCWGIVSHWPVVETKLFSKKKKCLSIQGFLSEIIFITASFRQGLASFFHGHSVDSWPVRGVQARTYLRLQTPTQRQMSGLRKQPAFLLARSDGAPAAWLNAATPILAAPPHRAFLNCSLLTSRCMDKWIDSGKMAEEI